jgi:hypothetical protein
VTTNDLQLLNTTIKNVFYEMNSLINITRHGAQLTIKNSKFEYINICGAVIKNFYRQWPSANFTDQADIASPNA